jgi:TDG/mug DNA glycosylase family protein
MTGQKQIAWGRQAGRFAGAETWILPNPSGLNRAFSLHDLVDAYRALHDASSAADAIERHTTRNSHDQLQP